jgi:hypothetical protein
LGEEKSLIKSIKTYIYDDEYTKILTHTFQYGRDKLRTKLAALGYIISSPEAISALKVSKKCILNPANIWAKDILLWWPISNPES